MTKTCTCCDCACVAALVLKALGRRTSREANDLYSTSYTVSSIQVESAGDKLRREAEECDAEDELIKWAREVK